MVGYLSTASPSVWCKTRSTQWWTMAMAGIYDDDWWRKNLRVTKSMFEALCRELRPFIERNETTFCKPRRG